MKGANGEWNKKNIRSILDDKKLYIKEGKSLENKGCYNPMYKLIIVLYGHRSYWSSFLIVKILNKMDIIINAN